jgi:RNA polymerase sigma-70 factor (ECF subfamily)
MTTAPDLPLPSVPPQGAVHPSIAPYPAEPARPSLRVVPAQPVGGEEIELDEALRRAGPRLQRYAVRRLRDEHEAQEVVQEALLRAFQHRELLATEDDLMAWLTVVTGRLVIDRLRVRGRSTPVADMPPSARASRDTADVVVARDEARIALDALEAMPGRQASVLWAREVEGLSYDEIGDRFAMSEPSVRSLLHRARRTLRREYAARGGSLPAVGLVAFAPWLRGLRVAGRLRHVARKGASGAAVAATGLAIATVVPFGAHTAPARPTHTTASPALRIKAVEVALPRHVHRAHAQPAAAPGHATAPVAPVGPTSTRLPGPSVCDARTAAGHSVSAGCDTHDSPTLYVRLPVPVAGNREIGVSKDGNKTCAVVPTTAVTECDSSTQSAPSKGNS